MSLDAVRTAIQAKMATISGIQVPEPVPIHLEDKTIVVYPQPGESAAAMNRGGGGGIVISARDTILVEYHRRIPEPAFGTVIGDVTSMTQLIRDAIWSEYTPAGSKFSGTADVLHSVRTVHFGELGWNEWTFGVRIAIDLTHFTEVA